MARSAKYFAYVLVGLGLCIVTPTQAETDMEDVAEYYKGFVAKPVDAFTGLSRVTDWDKNTFELSLDFAVIRTELGISFKPAVLKFIGQDINRHYFVALFLVSESFLQGHKPKPRLALNILRQGLKILRNIKIPRKTAFHFQAAILAQELGYPKMARYHKRFTRRLSRRFPGSIPAVSRKRLRIYKRIRS